MQAIVYNMAPDDIRVLFSVNNGKHQINQHQDDLNPETAKAASGNEVLIVLPENELTAAVLQALKAVGIKYLAVVSVALSNIDLPAAWACGFRIANITETLPGSTKDEDRKYPEMQQVVKNLDLWAAGKCVGKACCCANNCGIKPVNVKDQDSISY